MLLTLDKIFSPISAEAPGGVDIRMSDTYSKTYWEVRETRHLARQMERSMSQGSLQAQPLPWQNVKERVFELLEHVTKDLELCAWLIEACIRIDGFAGLALSLKITEYLLCHFWDTLHPQISEEGYFERCSAFAGLNGDISEGTLIGAIAHVPLTQGKNGEQYSLWHYQQAKLLLNHKFIEPSHHNNSYEYIHYEKFKSAFIESPAEFIEKSKSNITLCIDLYSSIEKIFIEKIGADAPPTSKIIQQLQECLNCLNHLSSYNNNNEQQFASSLSHSDAQQDPLYSFEVQRNTQEWITPNLIKDTQPFQAYLHQRNIHLQQLSLAADFFRTYEPQSILPYMLDRTIKWSNMKLPDLLQIWFKDQTILNEIQQLTGIHFNL